MNIRNNKRNTSLFIVSTAFILLLVTLIPFLGMVSTSYAWEFFEYNRDPLDTFDEYGEYRVCDACAPMDELLEDEKELELIYTIIYTLLTDDPMRLDELYMTNYDYLVTAMDKHEIEARTGYTNYPLFRYIRYEDLKKIMCTIFWDAYDHLGPVNPEVMAEQRIAASQFITILTGYNLDELGELQYNDEGEKEILHTYYEDLFQLEEKFLTIVIDAFLDGLFNVDPRVRLTCLDVIKYMGPHPYYKEAVSYAISLESIENIHEYAPLNEDDLFEETPAFDSQNRMTYDVPVFQWHKYLSIRGCEDQAIPYKSFTLFNKQISRIELLYHIEEVQDLSMIDFQAMSANLFTTLTNDINSIPQFPIVYDNDWVPEDEDIPTEHYLSRDSLFSRLSRNTLLDFNEHTTPPTFDYDPQGWPREAAVLDSQKIVLRVDRQRYDYDFNEPEGDLTIDQIDYIIYLFTGGMFSNDFMVQSKAANFLRDMYRVYKNHLPQSSINFILNAFELNPYFSIDTDETIKPIDIEGFID